MERSFNILREWYGEFSWSRAIRGLIFEKTGRANAWSGCEKERERMRNAADEMRSTLVEGLGNLGGYLVPPDYVQEQFVPLLRSRAVIRAAGAKVLPTNRDTVYIPRQTGGATADWYGENTTLNASNMTFDQIGINVKKLGALEYISNELLADASPSADELIREDLAAVIAVKEDSTFLLSNGVAPNWANAPVGIVNYVGVQAVTLTGEVGNGAAPVVGDLFQFKLWMMKNNIPADNWAWLISPRTWDEIAQFKDSQNRYVLDTLTGGNVAQYPAYGNYPEGKETSALGSVQGRLLGWPVYVTANLTENNSKGNQSDCTYMILARMPDVMIAQRLGLELVATQYAGTAFASDQTWIRAIMREGFGLRHPLGINVADGVR